MAAGDQVRLRLDMGRDGCGGTRRLVRRQHQVVTSTWLRIAGSTGRPAPRRRPPGPRRRPGGHQRRGRTRRRSRGADSTSRSRSGWVPPAPLRPGRWTSTRAPTARHRDTRDGKVTIKVSKKKAKKLKKGKNILTAKYLGSATIAASQGDFVVKVKKRGSDAHLSSAAGPGGGTGRCHRQAPPGTPVQVPTPPLKFSGFGGWPRCLGALRVRVRCGCRHGSPTRRNISPRRKLVKSSSGPLPCAPRGGTGGRTRARWPPPRTCCAADKSLIGADQGGAAIRHRLDPDGDRQGRLPPRPGGDLLPGRDADSGRAGRQGRRLPRQVRAAFGGGQGELVRERSAPTARLDRGLHPALPGGPVFGACSAAHLDRAGAPDRGQRLRRTRPRPATHADDARGRVGAPAVAPVGGPARDDDGGRRHQRGQGRRTTWPCTARAIKGDGARPSSPTSSR